MWENIPVIVSLYILNTNNKDVHKILRRFMVELDQLLLVGVV